MTLTNVKRPNTNTNNHTKERYKDEYTNVKQPVDHLMTTKCAGPEGKRP